MDYNIHCATMSEPTAIPPKPAGSFRLLHTADWHLGKMLNDQSRDEEHGLFLDWLLEVVSTHAVDANDLLHLRNAESGHNEATT